MSPASPVAVFPEISVSVTVIAPALFQSPPPSSAVFPVIVLFVKTVVPAPVMWYPPPFPGFAVTSGVLFPSKVSASKVKTPATERTSIPPPALLAWLFEIVIPSTTKVPSLVRIPPPEPALPVATLLSIKDVPSTVRAPLSL